jgi:hypothetical protein
MRRAHLFPLALILAVLGGAVTPASSAAQLKAKLPGKLGRVLGTGESQPTAVPKFNDRTIEITERHVAAVAAGLRMQNDSLEGRWVAYSAAKKAYDDSAAAYPGRQKAYEASRATWEACQEREVKPAMAAAEADMQRAQDEATGGDPAAMERAMAKVAERIKAAQARGDMAEVMRLADSVQKGSMMATQTAMASSDRMQKAADACGVEPEEPDAPRAPVYDRAILPSPRDPSLWTSEEQYGIMFDRLEPLLAIEKQADFDKALQNAFSAAEQQAIGSRAAELRAEMERRRTLLDRG